MLEIKIETTPETKQILKDNPTNIRKYLIEGMEEGYDMLVSETKNSFGSPGYPKVRTGNLKASIYQRIEEKQQTVNGILGARAEYAVYVDKLKPFLRPTLDRNRDRLHSIILRNIERRFNS
jgi:hypothetical protein